MTALGRLRNTALENTGGRLSLYSGSTSVRQKETADKLQRTFFQVSQKTKTENFHTQEGWKNSTVTAVAERGVQIHPSPVGAWPAYLQALWPLTFHLAQWYDTSEQNSNQNGLPMIHRAWALCEAGWVKGMEHGVNSQASRLPLEVGHV